MLHQNGCKKTVQSDILLFFPGTAIAGRHCTPAILQHPSEGIQFNPIQSKRMCLHIFVELLLVKKTKHLVDLTPFKQPLRFFLATELKPQNQTPRSLCHQYNFPARNADQMTCTQSGSAPDDGFNTGQIPHTHCF